MILVLFSIKYKINQVPLCKGDREWKDNKGDKYLLTSMCDYLISTCN